MKLATIQNGTRDGCLVVVNRQLTKLIPVPKIAKHLQHALDNWQELAEPLQEVYKQLNGEEVEGIPCSQHQFLSPLPRAYQWADGSAYVHHVQLVRRARGAEMPENFWTDPLMYQGGSDAFLGPTEAIPLTDEAYGLDFEAEIAVVTDQVPMGCSVNEAEKHIQLVMLVNDVSLRHLIPNEISKGFGFFQSKPASAFSPVAVTVDELGIHWQQGKVNLPLLSTFNNQLFGKPNGGSDMTFNFPQLIAHAAKTRALGPGTIIGSGTVSNDDPGVGSSCIAERRMLEIIANGKPSTPFMTYGDRIRIEMLDEKGQSIFGAIEQQVVRIENGAL